ncbi:MAG: hypothetical protein U0354_00315 [Candidatus Sericytochromatia bacterium]
MCISISSSTSGMVNTKNSTQTNLFNKATEAAKDGKITESEIKELEKIASSDGNLTGEEQLFLQSLKDTSTRSEFVKAAKDSNFDPNGFSFNVGSKLEVNSGSHKIKIEFADSPPPSKQMVGDIASAKDTLARIIPDNKKSEWDSLNKHDVNSVKKFLDSLNLNTDNKVKFVQAYMTANFNHPGIDINWGGASLQEGINAVPKDANGRKYLDCEAFVKLSSTLLGSNNVKEYGLASGYNGDKRDHQVAIFKSGNDAYVISNNEITKVKNSDNAESMIKEAHPDFKNVTEDLNGAMKADTGAYSVGDTLDTKDGGTIDIKTIKDATTMIGKISYPDGSNYHVKLKIDEDTGDYSYQAEPQKGDVFVTNNGTVINVGDMPNGVATLPNGNKANVKILVDSDGNVNFQ